MAVPVLMCNQVGGNDSLIFDGSSLALNARGELIAQAASFEEDLVVVDPFDAPCIPIARLREDDDTAAAYHALVLGTRDYVRKCGFRKVLVALSGGIDSALVAAIASRCAGRGERDRHRHAQPVLLALARSTTAASWPPTWASGLR